MPPIKSSPLFKHDHATLSFPPYVIIPFVSLYKLHKEKNTSHPQPLLEKSR